MKFRPLKFFANQYHMQIETKVAILWVMIMCGFAFHTFADMMPMFWSENIAVSDSGIAPVGMMTFIMTASYFIPVCGILLSMFSASKSVRMMNLILSILMLVFNIIHSAELLDFDPIQLPILPVILIVNVILCVLLWKMIKTGNKSVCK